jgi:hypothetical protein
VDATTNRTSLHPLQGVSAVLGVPAEPEAVEWLELVVQSVLRRTE